MLNFKDFPPALPWIVLAALPGMGPRSLQKVLATFRHAKTALQADAQQWRVAGLPPLTVDALRRWQQHCQHADLTQQALRDLEQCERDGLRIVTCLDADYPALLKEIHDPPALLYVSGDARLLSLPHVAIVGSRRASRNGARDAHELAAQLAERGLVICSGAALGIDSHAHQGALAKGGLTTAVLGCGIDQVYPQRNKNLLAKIAEQGVVISEFPLRSRPLKTHFPRRNRLVSGLSLGVLVVEAALQSGSLITARLALEQNRELFALPGSIHSPAHSGCLALLKTGAHLVTGVEDILAVLEHRPYWQTMQWLGSHVAGTEPAGRPQKRPGTAAGHTATLARSEQKVLALMDDRPLHLDSIIELSQLSAAEVGSSLVQLELEGLVSCEGGCYQRDYSSCDYSPPEPELDPDS